jgi:hypothetical protein
VLAAMVSHFQTHIATRTPIASILGAWSQTKEVQDIEKRNPIVIQETLSSIMRLVQHG